MEDMIGQELRISDNVRVHQTEGVRLGQIRELFPNLPTVNYPGFWVDLSFFNDDGKLSDLVEGHMSYILERTS